MLGPLSYARSSGDGDPAARSSVAQWDQAMAGWRGLSRNLLKKSSKSGPRSKVSVEGYRVRVLAS